MSWQAAPGEDQSRRRRIIPDGDEMHRSPLGTGFSDICREPRGSGDDEDAAGALPRHVEDFGDIHEVELYGVPCPEAAETESQLGGFPAYHEGTCRSEKEIRTGSMRERLALGFPFGEQVFPRWRRPRECRFGLA
ncbi:MAG: hypothetical protein ACLR78_04235 [Roseburia sp.]